MIYLDNAATSRVTQNVIDVITNDLVNNWSNPSSIYEFDNSKKILANARGTIASCLNCDPEEIYFTSGSSEGNAWAVQQKSKTMCSAYEHHNIINNPKSVIVDEDYLDRTAIVIGNNTVDIVNNYENFLVSWMMVNNETGEMFNTKYIANLAHFIGASYHCDITQAVGNMPIDLHGKHSYIDIATASAHKFHGPKGIGFIYFNKNTFPQDKIKPLIYGGIQENNKRAGTENIPYIDGMAVALKDAVDNVMEKHKHCTHLKARYYEELMKNFAPENMMIVSPAKSIASTATVCFKDIEGEIMTAILAEHEIYCSSGSACNTGDLEPSSVLAGMKIPDEYLRGEVRISMDLSNTEEEVVQTAKLLKSIYMELTQQ